eukprot:jgi/Botrbrau1/8360/Bobra.0046s0021.1
MNSSARLADDEQAERAPSTTASREPYQFQNGAALSVSTTSAFTALNPTNPPPGHSDQGHLYQGPGSGAPPMQPKTGRPGLLSPANQTTSLHPTLQQTVAPSVTTGSRQRSAAPAARRLNTGVSSAQVKKHCNCKASKCLKLYCECFASGKYCDSCNCVQCNNIKEYDDLRSSAMNTILERNPNAFRPKIHGGLEDDSCRHNKGCNCKKSNCLKKYCECFQAGIFCATTCKCQECKNYEGSDAREVVLRVGASVAAAAMKRAESSGLTAQDMLDARQIANTGGTGVTVSTGTPSPHQPEKRRRLNAPPVVSSSQAAVATMQSTVPVGLPAAAQVQQTPTIAQGPVAVPAYQAAVPGAEFQPAISDHKCRLKNGLLSMLHGQHGLEGLVTVLLNAVERGTHDAANTNFGQGEQLYSQQHEQKERRLLHEDLKLLMKAWDSIQATMATHGPSFNAMYQQATQPHYGNGQVQQYSAGHDVAPVDQSVMHYLQRATQQNGQQSNGHLQMPQQNGQGALFAPPPVQIGAPPAQNALQPHGPHGHAKPGPPSSGVLAACNPTDGCANGYACGSS